MAFWCIILASYFAICFEGVGRFSQAEVDTGNNLAGVVSPHAALLPTKLYIPPARTDFVQRPRLTGRLNEAVQRKLTLISAPTGFGKTTLLGEWIPASPRCVTWVSLDKGDNDPLRFWSYVIASLQMLRSDLGKRTQALLDSPNPPTFETMLASLVNEIGAFPDVFALALDDYHVIDAQPVHQALAYLLDNMPRNMHLVITSREAGDLSIELAATEVLGYVQMLQGKLRNAEKTYQKVLRRYDNRFHNQAIRANIGMGVIHREWDDLDAARRYLDSALEIDRKTGFGKKWPWLHVENGRIHAATGEMESAIAEMNRAIEMGEQLGNRRIVREASAYLARFALVQGDLNAIEKWNTQVALQHESDIQEGREIEYLTQVRWLFSQSEYERAINLLQRLQQAAEADGRMSSVVECLALEALALHAQRQFQ